LTLNFVISSLIVGTVKIKLPDVPRDILQLRYTLA
jgi:hypothetical protein